MQRNLVIAVSVVLLHVAGLWAFQTGLLRRATSKSLSMSPDIGIFYMLSIPAIMDCFMSLEPAAPFCIGMPADRIARVRA